MALEENKPLQTNDPPLQSWERKHQNFEQRFPEEYYDPEKAKGRVLQPGDKSKYGNPWAENEHQFPSPFLDIGKYTPQAPSSKPEPNDALKFWQHPSPKVIPIREGNNIIEMLKARGFKLTPVDYEPFKTAADVDKSLPYIPGPFVPLQLERSPPAAEGLFQKGMNPPRLNPNTGQPGPDKRSESANPVKLAGDVTPFPNRSQLLDKELAQSPDQVAKNRTSRILNQTLQTPNVLQINPDNKK